MTFETMSSDELDQMDVDALVAESQRAGVAVDELRDYRRDLKARYSAKLNANTLRAQLGDHLTDEQAAQISAIVSAPRLTVNTKVNHNG